MTFAALLPASMNSMPIEFGHLGHILTVCCRVQPGWGKRRIYLEEQDNVAGSTLRHFPKHLVPKPGAPPRPVIPKGGSSDDEEDDDFDPQVGGL